MAKCQKCGAEFEESDRQREWDAELSAVGRNALGVSQNAQVCEACRREAMMFGAAVFGSSKTL